MLNKRAAGQLNKGYLIGVTLLTFVIPVLASFIDHLIQKTSFTAGLYGKWFIFSAVGLRLCMAGIRQATNPGFTAKEIFHITSEAAFPIVRELGFANLCFGTIALISVFKPEWRTAGAFGSGSYFLLAGLLHLSRKPTGINERFALWTDLIIFAVCAVYLLQVQ